MANYLVLVCCGTAITSTTVARRVREILRERGYAVETTTVRAPDARHYINSMKPDLAIFTAAVPADIPCPTLQGVPFLSGVGREEAVAAIIEILNKPHWAGKERV